VIDVVVEVRRYAVDVVRLTEAQVSCATEENPASVSGSTVAVSAARQPVPVEDAGNVAVTARVRAVSVDST
jgi:hypothetical protein